MAGAAEDEVSTPCVENDPFRTYLLTYSQADLDIVPNSRTFADIVLEAYNDPKECKVEILDWAACQEPHANSGKHYHMILKLNGTRRWKPWFEAMQRKWGINVNFSHTNKGYLKGYRYIIKEKSSEMVVHSPGHADLTSARSPMAKKGFVTSSQNAKRRRMSAPPRQPSVEQPSASRSATASNSRPTNPPQAARPTNPPHQATPPTAEFQSKLRKNNVIRFIRRNNLHTEDELLAAAKKREMEGLPDVYNYVSEQSPKTIDDILTMVWRLEAAPGKAQRDKMTRMDIVLSYLEKPCVEGCEETWLDAALEILNNNNINPYTFAEHMRKCLIVGRAKYHNIYLFGPKNCGKSFLLNPLEDIFKCFMNPTEGKYCWVGLEKCEVCILQDLSWSPELIKWTDFLILLEGQTVHLARPKNAFTTDLKIDKTNKIPFLATAKLPMVLKDSKEQIMKMDTDMMDSRWRFIEFTHSMPEEEIRRIPECPHCFSVLITRGMDG